MPLRTDVEVGLLIGTNCARAIKPREIIPGIIPYAKKTVLGWGIIGTVDLNGSEEVDESCCSESSYHTQNPCRSR